MGCAVAGCSRDQVDPQSAIAAEPAVQVVIPDSALMSDATVNEFVRTAIQACTNADYERFRALWSATDEPFTRDQFEHGWKTAKKISLHDIKPLRHPDDGSLLYYVHAGVELGANVRQPRREVVLLVVKQDDQWRLSRAPENLVKRVLGKKPDGGES